MTRVPILSGVYTDNAPDYRKRLPRNMVPVPLETGLSQGYLRPGDGLVAGGTTPPGGIRGSILLTWRSLVIRGEDFDEPTIRAALTAPEN